MKIAEDVVLIGDRSFAEGDTLTIDGTSGEVLLGAVSGGAQVVPEAAKLLAWAEELGIDVGPEGETVSDAIGEEALSREALVHVMLI